MNGLSRTDFDEAVKDALRHYTQSDMLAGNKLFNTRLMPQRGSAAACAQDLQALLAATTGTLFADPGDDKIHRVIRLTYFDPASTQEAAAGQLGLSPGAYRRCLTSAVGRLADYLWDQDQCASRAAVSANLADAGRRPLSLIVLPFLNLSPDADFGYFVDGVVDGLMTEVYRALADSFIVSRSTAFTFRGGKVPVRQIGNELQVRYVLEGSILADALRVRVNAQLIDAITDEHIWVERFDKERKDVLRAHEEIVARLARGVRIEMLRSEAARCLGTGIQRDDPTELVIRGRALVTDVRQDDNASLAVSLFRRALELEPARIEAMVGIAATRIFQLLLHCHTGDRDVLLDEAENLISNAFNLAPDHLGVLKARSLLLRARGKFAEAAIATQAVLAQSPGEPTALREMGLNKLYLGKPLEAAEWLRRADRVAPADAMRWTWLQGLGIALMQLGQDAEAVTVSRQAVQNHPGWARGKAVLAAAEALAGDIESGQRHMAQFIESNPGETAADFVAERPAVPEGAVSPGYRRGLERVLEGLCRAGLPAGSSRPASCYERRPISCGAM